MQIANVLDRNVAMADNIAILVQVLWRSVIVGRGVDKEASVKVLSLNHDVERGVRRDFDTNFGFSDDGRDHVGLRGDLAHRYAIAGPGLDLHAIGEF